MGYPRTGSQSAPWTIFQISPISISSFFSCILYMSAQIVDGFPIFLLYIYIYKHVSFIRCHVSLPRGRSNEKQYDWRGLPDVSELYILMALQESRYGLKTGHQQTECVQI